MSLPAAVTAQAEKAAQLMQSIQSGENPADPSAAPGTASVSPTQPQPPASTAQAAAGTPAPSDSRDTDPAYWRARFEIMQGKYNAEVPALVQQVKDLQAQMSELSGRLSAQPDPNTPPATPVTPEELTEYTPEYFDMMGRFVDAKVQPMVKEKDQQIGNLESSVSRLEQSLQTQYEANLDLLVPKWREINVMPSFISWLNGAVVSTNPPLTAMDALQEANSKRNATRVAQMFLDWAKASGFDPGKPPSGFIIEPPASAGAPPSPPMQQAQGRLWKRSEISAFYADVARGYYRGRETEKANLERDIMAAQGERRIVPG